MCVIRTIENINSKTKHEAILNIQHNFTNNNKHIIIVWVPSHQGIQSNEEADIAGKETTSFSSDVIRRRIPYQNLVVTPCQKTIMEQNRKCLQKNKKTHEIIQDFNQTMPTNNMKSKAG